MAISRNSDSKTIWGALDETFPACIVPTFARTHTAQSSSSFHQRDPVNPSTLPLCPSQFLCVVGCSNLKIPWPISVDFLAGCHIVRRCIDEGLSNFPSRREIANLRRSQVEEIIPPAAHSTDRFDSVALMRSCLIHINSENAGQTPAVLRNVSVE